MTRVQNFQVIHGHNRMLVSGHRTIDAAQRAAARERRSLDRWVNAPHGGNRSAGVWVEIVDATGKRVG